MDNFTKSNRFIVTLLLTAVIFLPACSDDNKDKAPSLNVATKSSVTSDIKKNVSSKLEDKQHYEQMSQPVDKANWTEKGRFNKEFKKDCINRELKHANKTEVDRPFIEKTCDCIADYMDDHLTDQEAEEFLGEDNHMRSLQIRYDTGAYHCIQESTKTKEPKITKFR